MRTNKIEFIGKVGFDNAAKAKPIKALVLKFLSDENCGFNNYSLTEKNYYLIPVTRDFNWKKDKSLFIDYEDEISKYLRRYLRISERKGLSFGISFYDNSYTEFFIGDKYFEKHYDLMERNFNNWLDDKASFSDSTFIKKYKYLNKYLYWTGGSKCFSDNLYVEFTADYRKDYEIIKEFYLMDFTPKNLDKYFSRLNKTRKIFPNKKF